ncbi:hypothetical protein [Lysinibacter cavernae]|uniref:hypothetical protein n=1 Tax=Lysinibacter cavernae TaxID=1640652 RepID=UPI00360A95DB
MSSPALVYRTTNKEALRKFKQLQENVNQREMARDQLAESLAERFGTKGPRTFKGVRAFEGGFVPTVIEAEEGEIQSPPVGTRYDRADRGLMPALRTAEGKALRSEMVKVSTTGLYREFNEAVGIPSWVTNQTPSSNGFNRSYFGTSRLSPDETALDVLWSSDSVLEQLEKHFNAPEQQQNGWARIPLSEWHREKE